MLRLQKSRFREGVDRLRDDQVIEHPHVDESEGFPQPPRDELIRGAGLRQARGMIVVEHDRRRVMRQSRLDDFARVDRGTVDRAPEKILDGDESMPAVEVQHAEHLVLAGAEMHAEELTSEGWRGENGRPDAVALRKKRLGTLEHVTGPGLMKAGLIADVKRGHDGGPLKCRAGLPGARTPRRSAAVNDRRPRPRGARVLERVIDGENGVVPLKGTSKPALLSLSMAPITIRPYQPTDAASLTRLFRDSVRRIAAPDYTASQLRAWAPDLIDEQKFGHRCGSKATWVAEVEGRIAGFSDLEPDGHIDMLYVHPDFQRRGVARALLRHVEDRLEPLDLRRLYAEASITALPAFEAVGFRVVVPQTTTVRGETMTNYRIEKRLEAPADLSPSTL